MTDPADSRPLVALIHGINSAGDWYDRVEPVLKPFFRCCRIRYAEYETNAELKLASLRVGTWCAVTCALLFATLLSFGSTWWILSPFALLACAFAWIAIKESERRRAASEAVRGGLDGSLDLVQDRMHVIAHSFGTVLFCENLREDPVVLFGTLIFAGSALPEKYDWIAALTARSIKIPAFASIRNETGTNDLAIKMASWLRWFVPGIGGAGSNGFRSLGANRKPCFHFVKEPLGPCLICNPTKRTSPLHNVKLAGYSHSTWFLNKGHATVLWLPVLWDMEPFEYVQFAVRCCEVQRLGRQSLSVEQQRVLEELMASTLRWTSAGGLPLPLREYVDERVRSRINELGLSKCDSEVAQYLRAAVTQATALVQAGLAKNAPDDVRRLTRPDLAVAKAIHMVVR